MKTFLKFLFVFSSLLVLSCDDVEPTVYQGDVNNEGTFLSFSSSLYTLPIIINETGSVTITLNSSTVSSVDRVYNLDIIEDESTANPETYTFPSTITVPAGSHQGTIVVTGEDNGLVDTTAKPFVFQISNITDEYMDVQKITVNVVEVCPLGDEFVGNYRINQITGTPLGDGLTIFPENAIVELEVGESEFERTFKAMRYPGIANQVGSLEVTVSFNLTCNETVLSQIVDMQFFCTEGNSFVIDRGVISASYNNEDDSVIELTVTEDATATCISPTQTTIRLTKVN